MNREKNNFFPKKGEIWLLKNYDRIKEISKDYRPVLIISEDEQNEFSDFIVVLPLSSDLKKLLRNEVLIEKNLENGLDKTSKVVCYSPFTWDKKLRFEKKLGFVSKKIMSEIKEIWNFIFFREEQ
jgi:mRNA-degrading endonuclease toxin of MazEF toxin-antitoxin module